MVYLDHAATTATHPEVIKEMLPFFRMSIPILPEVMNLQLIPV